ncbi:MAG: NAD-dependent epimerase/dehydratase family protein [Patescibacteria group bacterium]
MSFIKKKKVLVTGASGFLGTNLTRGLVLLGANVVTLSRKGASENLAFRTDSYLGKIDKDIKGSVTNYSLVDKTIKDEKIDIVFHLAAQPLVEKGREGPRKTFKVNVEGTWNVLEASRKAGVDKVILSSTTHVYGNNPDLPYKEEYYPRPSRPYETSKACSDLLGQSYYETYGLLVEIPRFVNIYGPGDLNFNRLVPQIIKTIIDGKSPSVWIDDIVRDFLYVDDAVNAYLSLAKRKHVQDKDSRVFNFGSGKNISIHRVAKMLVALSGDRGLNVKTEPMPVRREGEVLKQYVSIAKAKKQLGWKPRYSLEDGLKRTYDWYRKYLNT